MSHVATSIAPAHHTGTSPDQVGRKSAHACSITCMFQSLSHTHTQVAHTSASLAKACRYLASADCCSLRLCSSASSSLFCLASSICLMSLHSHLSASRFNKAFLFSTLQCSITETPHMVHDTQLLSHGQLVCVHKVQRCVQHRHSGTTSPVSKCRSCLEAMLFFTVRPMATDQAQTPQKGQPSCSFRMRCRGALALLSLAIRMPEDIDNTHKQAGCYRSDLRLCAFFSSSVIFG